MLGYQPLHHSDIMLWKKESSHKNALYINICASNGTGTTINDVYKEIRSAINSHKKMKQLYEKCNKTALVKRIYGNGSFNTCDWDDAIEKYNESLCFAEKESIDLGLAYSNRSVCYYNMGMYKECMIDIELAKANHYQKNLFPYIDKRKEDCVKLYHQKQQLSTFEPKLSFPADETVPCMANSIEIHRGDDGRHFVVAKADINAGDTIVIEEAFLKTSFVIYGWKCVICLKNDTNLIPCKKCTVAMFCRDCEHNNIHKYECGMKTSLYNPFNNHLMQELRTFVVAMNLFSTADEMIEFVEKTLARQDTKTPDLFTDDRSKYAIFLKLVETSNVTKDTQFCSIVYCIYKILLEIPQVGVMFHTKKHRRFLMHLIGHHVQVNLCESYVASKNVQDEYGNWHCRNLYSQIGLMVHYFKHSCTPNVFMCDYNSDTVYTAVRPIKKGEQLYVSYFSMHWDSRERRLWKIEDIKCKCERCEHLLPTKDQVKALSEDDDYQFLHYRTFNPEFDVLDEETFNDLKGKCVNLLNRFGRIHWCSELGYLIGFFCKVVRYELTDRATPN